MMTRDLIMFAMSSFVREFVGPENHKTIIRLNSLEKNTYLPPDGSEPISYVGQMEPIVKWIMRTREGTPFDLVMLCSKKSYSEYYSNDDKVTSVQYFGRKISDAFDTFVMDELEVDIKLPFSIYETEDRMIRFVLVPLDEDAHPMKAIQSTVEYIRKWKQGSSSEEAGNFYIDIHGGFRDVDLIQNAIMSLLKIDGIVPAGVYSGIYSRSHREFHHKDASYAYGMFDFVSAMNEFINYGHGKELKAYFDRTGRRSEEEKKVTAAMDEVSRGLELCDPEAYKTGLNSLNKALNALSDSAPSELSIFRDYIKESFGDLLSPRTRTTLLIVKRCIEKGLFQAALTFIESSMPAEIVAKQLLYYPQTEGNISQIEMIAEANHTYGDDNKYTFFDNCLRSIRFFSKDVFRNIKADIRQTENDEKKIQRKAEARELKMAVSEFADNDGEFLSLLDKEKDLRNIKMQYGSLEDIAGSSNITGIDSVLTGHDRILLGYFLRMHKALKRCRNTINHGDSERPDFERIQKLLKLYVAYGEALYSRAEVSRH